MTQDDHDDRRTGGLARRATLTMGGRRQPQAGSPESHLRRVGPYEVRGLLGEGATGRVYRGYDPRLRREAALKVIRAPFASDATAMKRFRREAEAVGRLSHPGIVSVYELGESYIALELVEGESLAALLARRGRLPPEQALPVLAAIAGALDHVHARGVVHRDVKPSNVLVASSGGVKVTDFGTAHLAWAPMTRTGELIGSPAYMAPEQIVRGGIQPASDVYALGVVAFETLTGTLPFRGRNLGELLMRIAVEPPPSARGPNPALPPGVDLVLARAFAKDPGHRFQSARNMVAALEAAFGEGGGTARGLVEGLLLAGTSLLGPW